MSWWALLLLGWALAAGIQLALYLVQLRTRKATAVDAGWAASLVGIVVLYAALGEGEPEHRILIAAVAGLELARITWVVAKRIPGAEDRRYRELRARWRERGREQRSFFVFFQAQAFLAALLSVVFLPAVENGRAGIEPLEWLGLAVWAVGAGLEAAADHQLGRHKADPANRGRTLRSGLWRYSRHPNYFGQWLTWCGYALIALAAPYGWAGLGSPALVLFLVLFVTGVPPAEEQALKSRGEDYRRYQQETPSPFVPWFPRRAG
jgi:steroid 5-alpha reductase family enzyme